MKKKKGIICMCALLTVCLITTGCGKEIEVKNGSKVAVSVKGEKFTATEYYEKIKEDNIATLIDMIDTSLLEKKYKETDEEKEAVKSQIEQVRAYYGSDETTYNTFLKSYFGVESEKELETKLKLEYKRSLAVKDYLKEHATDTEVNKYYKEEITGEIKASHILISVDVAASATEEEKTEAEEKALKKAQDIIKKIKNGEDFAALAKKNSTDEGSAKNGGDLGYFQPSGMVEEFANAVKALKVDEYTKEPVKSKYGYHIILKTGEKDKPELEEVEEEIREAIATKKLNEDSSLYYKTLMDFRKENKISWNDDILKKAYENYMDRLIESAVSNS